MAESISASQMTGVDKKAEKLEKWIQQWKKVWQKGKYSYILQWGLLMSIVNACGDILGYHYHHINFPKIGLYSVAYYLTIWLILGFSVALAMWYGSEHHYSRAMKQLDLIKEDSKGKP